MFLYALTMEHAVPTSSGKRAQIFFILRFLLRQWCRSEYRTFLNQQLMVIAVYVVEDPQILALVEPRSEEKAVFLSNPPIPPYWSRRETPLFPIDEKTPLFTVLILLVPRKSTADVSET